MDWSNFFSFMEPLNAPWLVTLLKILIIAVTGILLIRLINTGLKKALEKLDFVNEAEASHEKGTAVVRLCGKMDEDAVRKAIAEEDYELLEVQIQTT